MSQSPQRARVYFESKQTHGNFVEGVLVVVGLEAGVDMTTTEEGVIMVSLGSCSSRLGSKVGAVSVSMASNLAHFPSSVRNTISVRPTEPNCRNSYNMSAKIQI